MLMWILRGSKALLMKSSSWRPKKSPVLEGAEKLCKERVGIDWQGRGRSSNDYLRAQRLPLNGINVFAALYLSLFGGRSYTLGQFVMLALYR